VFCCEKVQFSLTTTLLFQTVFTEAGGCAGVEMVLGFFKMLVNLLPLSCLSAPRSLQGAKRSGPKVQKGAASAHRYPCDAYLGASLWRVPVWGGMGSDVRLFSNFHPTKGQAGCCHLQQERTGAMQKGVFSRAVP